MHRMDALYAGQHGDRIVSYCCAAVLALFELALNQQDAALVTAGVVAVPPFSKSTSCFVCGKMFGCAVSQELLPVLHEPHAPHCSTAPGSHGGRQRKNPITSEET
ncbi:hypothetical protein KRP22_003291 [Phytophthora ramorum]|nr:hypothetical protein KRP22_6943 [Phytophthora ramorum]